jgi:hypothetical protein
MPRSKYRNVLGSLFFTFFAICLASSVSVAHGAVLTISNVQVSVSDTTATITWNTNIPADSEIGYLWFLSKTNVVRSGLVTQHSVTLTVLFSGQLYEYTIKSISGDGQSAFRDYESFTTQVAPGSSFIASATETKTITPSDLFAPLSAASSSPADNLVFTKNLYFGIRDAQVQTLQSLFVGRGYLVVNDVTGFFGNLTLRALQKFQCDQNIVCTGGPGWGTVGPKTRNVLNGSRG